MLGKKNNFEFYPDLNIEVNFYLNKAINLPNEKIAVCTEDPSLLIFKIFPDQFSLQTKINIETNIIILYTKN